MAGDLLSYTLGRLLREPIRRRYGHLPAWRQAERALAQRGGLAIVLTRFLLTPLAVPVNLIAGGVSYPAGRFARYAAGGEAVWLLGYGALGYLFSSQWEQIGALAGSGSGALAGGALYALARWLGRRAAPRFGQPNDAPAGGPGL